MANNTFEDVAPEERVVTLCGGVLHITLPRVRYHS